MVKHGGRRIRNRMKRGKMMKHESTKDGLNFGLTSIKIGLGYVKSE
jgi:hypothetical protein